MQDYKMALEAQLREIDTMISQLEKKRSEHQDPEDLWIGVGRSNGHDQYYWVDMATKKRKYVRSAEMETLRKAAQRHYETAVNRKLKSIRKTIAEFLRRYDLEGIDQVYSRMGAARKKLVTPVIKPTEEYVEQWKSVEYEPLPNNENTELYTNGGVRVRSKSELIIANLLEQNKIPYRYEFPITLMSVGGVRPDFLCLNIRTRTEYIWEHFGMMDNIAYANKNIAKINSYEQNGYFAGKNMIMTFETSQITISSNLIKATIKQYLL